MSDISSELAGRSLVVTIKYGKGYEEPWLVFRGLPAEVRADIIATFGVDAAGAATLTLAELVLNVAGMATAMQLAAVQLDAVAIGERKTDTGSQSPFSDPQRPDEAQAALDPWFEAEQQQEAPPQKPNQHLYDTIESISSVPDLQVLWAENQSAFTEDAELLDAWKARGRALSGK